MLNRGNGSTSTKGYLVLTLLMVSLIKTSRRCPQEETKPQGAASDHKSCLNRSQDQMDQTVNSVQAFKPCNRRVRVIHLMTQPRDPHNETAETIANQSSTNCVGPGRVVCSHC